MLSDAPIILKPRHKHYRAALKEYTHTRPDLLETMGQLKEKTPDILIFDMETDGLLDECTKIHCIALTDTQGEVSLFASHDIPMALHHLTNARQIIGHNILGFDIPAIKKLYPEWQTQASIRDTLVMSRLAYPDLMEQDFKNGNIPKNLRGSHSLKAWGYRLNELKGEFSHEDTDWSEYTEEMGDYCVQDTVVNLHLARKLNKENLHKASIELEQDFFVCLRDMEKNGVQFDTEGCASLYAKLLQRRDEITAEMGSIIPPKVEEMKSPQYWEASDGSRYLTKSAAPSAVKASLKRGPNKVKETPFNPNSRDQIASFFIDKYGWKPQDWTPTGKPMVDESILRKTGYPEAEPIADYMMLTKRIGQVSEGDAGWLRLVKGDRIHGRVNHNGAVTGRCTHSSPNMAQVPSTRAEYGTECRSLFTTRKGYKMVGVDMSGLELRCLAHYMAQWDDGAYTQEILSGDIHSVNQKAAGLATRDQAKTFIYAFLYGAGTTKLGEITGGGISAGKTMRRKFLSALPALRNLSSAVKEVATTKGRLTGLDGRPLPVRSPYSALNTLLQSAGAVAMKKATSLIVNEINRLGLDAKLVLHVHDEVQLEVREDQAEQVGKMACDAMERAGQYFSLRCPLAGEYRVGDNWAETH